MRSILRLLWLGTLVLLLAAIVVGRAAPAPTWEPTPVRFRSPATDAIIDCRLDGELRPCLFDGDSSRLTRLDRPQGMALIRAAISPWQDDRGRRQVVGLAYTLPRTMLGTWGGDYRLVRLSYPDGSVLDSIPFDEGSQFIISPPCWAPGTLARVLFSGGDGLVYRLDFERCRADGAIERVLEPRPAPLIWGVDPPGNGPVTLQGPAWLTDARLGGRVLVELQCGRPGAGGLTRPQLWWLQLDQFHSTIMAAGRLTRSDPRADPDAREERSPLAFSGPDDSPLLAYLDRPRGTHDDYTLRVAPLRFDPRTGEPLLVVRESWVLGDGCSQSPPVASSDGRYLAVRIQAQGDVTMRRLPVPCPFPERTAAHEPRRPPAR